MIRKKIDELQGNEILGKPLMTWDYQIILPEGAMIRPDYIEKIKALGVLDVWVTDPYVEDLSDIGLLRNDISFSPAFIRTTPKSISVHSL